jgi:hypothetical protein
MHDVTFGNVEWDGFDMALHIANPGNQQGGNITITGNRLTNIQVMGELGAVNNTKLNYNEWIDSGGDTILDHVIYAAQSYPIDGLEIIGNYISGFATSIAEQNTQCMGVMVSGGGEESNVTFRGNVIEQKDPALTNGSCYGFAFGHHTWPDGGALHNVVIDGNVFINMGNVAIGLQTCSVGCVIKNNLIYTQRSVSQVIMPILSRARTNAEILATGACTVGVPAGHLCTDEVSGGIKVLNNTIYSSPANTTGMTAGIDLGIEGTGHVIANNSITYMGSTASFPVNCFNMNLASSAYTSVNNHCYSAYSGYKWEASTNTSLSAWQIATGLDAGSFTTTPNWGTVSAPTFSSSTTGPALWATYFKPVSAGKGNNLISTGNHTYAPTLDILGATFVNPPDIGAYAH